MALRLKVTNTSDTKIGRFNYVFDPGENDEITIEDTFGISVLFDADALDVKIVHADTLGEVPIEYRSQLTYDITEPAKELADEHGIDLFGVEGSGDGGRILKSDIEAIIEEGEGSLTKLPVTSTRDSIEEQKRAEDETQEKLLAQREGSPVPPETETLRKPSNVRESTQLGASGEKVDKAD